MILQIHARIQSFLKEPHASDSLLGSVQRLGRRLSQQQNQRRILSLETHDNPEPESEVELYSIPAIYVRPTDPFPAVEDFVTRSAKTYGLSLTEFTIGSSNMTLRDVFENYLSEQPKIQAILVGTRRSDPHGEGLSHFNQTDRGWPDFVRIHPVIDWSYTEIWAFIRHLGLEYCSLYNEGYTSLGGTSDTQPNPKLLKEGFSSTEARNGSDTMAESEQYFHQQYYPAYELGEERSERLGRK